MYETSYVRATSVDEAVAWLREQEEARPLSGGMTLIPTLKQRLAAPSHLIDLTRIDALRGVSVSGDTLRVGALTRHAEVAASEVVANAIPALAQLAGVIADPQVRNRGTMGGSVANNDPAADYPSAVLALDARVVTSSRTIAADDFFIDTFETALAPAELVTALEYRIPLRAAYAKFRQPASGYAVVGVFVAEYADGVRVGVTGASASVFRWREAEAALAREMSEASLATVRMDPAPLPDDDNASSTYRAHLVETYTRRAVQALLAQPPRHAD